MLVFWFVPEMVVGAKFLRYTLSVLPLVYMTAAIGTVLMWRALSSAITKLISDKRVARLSAAVAVGAIFVIAPAFTTLTCLLHSYPSLYLNAFGGKRVGYFFPHDEFYDLGARESIQFVAETAPRGAALASEIPGVVQYYLERFNRPDIRSLIISQPGFSLSNGRPDFVLLQHGRVYFENLENFNFIEKNFPLVQTSVYEGAAATRVFATNGK
jgi:hypothetical protein